MKAVEALKDHLGTTFTILCKVIFRDNHFEPIDKPK